MKSNALKTLSLCLFAFAGAARAELVDRVAAVVNNDIITLSEVETRAGPELSRAASLPTPQSRAEARQKATKAALDSLIAEKLLDNEMKELNIDVTDLDVTNTVEEMRKQNNNATPEQFETMLKESGFTMEKYKDFLRKQLMRQKLMGLKVRNKVHISDEDLKTEYTRWSRMEQADGEVHARHILVKLNAKPSQAELDAALKKAEAIALEARKPGVDFAELAKKKSEGSSAGDGGDLGFFRRGVMQAQIDKASFTLKVGEVSDPIRSTYGYHVIKVDERRQVEVKPFEQMKDELRERLLKDQLEKYTAEYVTELRGQALVEEKL
jgi:peptidyl-prolyl cis-trans isomerase SurA